MSRRNQSRRRRTYGRRQHEVRERRVDVRDTAGLLGDDVGDMDSDWQATDTVDERAGYGESFGSYGR